MEKEAAMEEDPGDYASLEAEATMEEDPDDCAWLGAEGAMEEDPVTVSLGPVGSLFQQLRSAISWQYRSLKGVKAEIQILGQGLEGLCADLKDLSEAEDTITRCLLRQVRDLCYDASDYLDELMHFIHYSSGIRPGTRLSWESRRGYQTKIFRVSRRPAACNQLRLSLPRDKKFKRVPLIAKLSALIARVEDADERRKRFKIPPPQASKYDYEQVKGLSQLMPQLPLQPHVDKLIKLLDFDNDHDHDERKHKLTTIFGSAGVGKTAVARTLYHRYRGRFQYRAFLRVSRDPDMRRILADLLSQIKAPPPPAHAFSDVEGLTATINKHLQEKRYLIVIDDLWDTSTWDIISRGLPDGDYCRIIITTQIEDVALTCCSDQLKHIYEITPLNDDQSGISEGGFTAYPSTEGMKEALNLVYNNLPPHLKACLLYHNIFPEGWTVKKDELVKQWVAEGFISSVQGQNAEETAGCYFDALVSTGMVQSVDTNDNDEVLSCTLHHMVLDLIRQKSMEENFVTIVNYFQTIIGLPDKVRRLSVQLGGAKGANNISENMRISQVRSLIFSGFFRSVPSIMEYGLLKVLILHIWSDEDRIFDLSTIGELYRLRYLKIECSITVKLPRKIRRLQQLGTLQVDARLYAVPSDIVHLEKLRHLHLPSESILPHGVGRMTCIRTLGCFDLGSNSEDNVRDLGELENLQELQLTCSAVQPAESLEKNVQVLLGSVLKKLGMLQSITLVPAAGSSNVSTLQDGAGASSMIVSCDGSSSVSPGPAPAHLQRLQISRRCCIFSRLPKWIGELWKLSILKIAVRELSKEDNDILKGLPSLTALSLHVQTMSAEGIVFGKEGFSLLTYFKFTCTVPQLKFEDGAMPNLEKLKLCFNSPIVDGKGTSPIITIERLSGLKEISAIIGSAGVDAGYAWQKAIKNDPRNPNVQVMGSIYYDDKGRGMVTREGSGEDEKNEADFRVHTKAESSRLPVPVPAARCREDEPEDRPFRSEIISIPSESQSTDGHSIKKVVLKLDLHDKERGKAFHAVAPQTKYKDAYARAWLTTPHTTNQVLLPTNKAHNQLLRLRATMDLSTGAMGSLLLKLGDLLMEEYKLQTGVKEDIEYMQRELTSMYDTLRKVGEVPRDQLDQQVKSWADEVRDLSYIMEDIIDKFLVRVQGAGPAVKLKWLMKMGDFFTKSKTRHEISDEIERIKVRVKEAADRRDKYKVIDVVANPASATIADPRLVDLYKDKKYLVGIDGPMNELTKILSDGHGDECKQLKIVSIFGFGGLGKTTLAKALYDKLKSPFDCSAFVPVGRNPNMKKLLNDILYEIEEKMYPELDERQLINKLRGLLENKRYFIVIDDIWDTETWDRVKCALVDNNCASRIIITTRILDVATKTGEVYRIKPLSNDLSKELFHSRLFGGNSKCPSDLPAKVYDKILHKCGGVPLAIITIASLLVDKPVELWSEVYNSIGFGNEHNKYVDNTRKILLFSYYDLPCHLRTCLLYLSIYPEDKLIEKDSLIWKWVGEGFIPEEPGVGLYEIGERYFNELVNKGMLLPVEDKDEYTIISGCRIHDMVLDMICLLAKEENFVTLLDNNQQYTSLPTNARRLAIGEREDPLPRFPMLQVRSLNAECSADMLPSLSCFQVLRVLSLFFTYDDGVQESKYVEHLGKLIHLRYLGLGGGAIPEEIGDLKFLQVLDLAWVSELPRCIGLLSQLKCLNAPNAEIEVAQDWIGNLTSLQELCVGSVDASSNFVAELGKLAELRKLRICGFLELYSVNSINALTESLFKLQKIQVIDVANVLSFYTGGDVTLCEGYVPPQQLRVFKLPYMNSQPGLLASITSSPLPNLTHLCVHVDSPDVEIFGRFPGLVALSLYMDRPSQGHYVMGGAGVGLFPKLRVYNTTAASPGPFLPGAMPSLESLEFSVEVWTSRDGNIHFDLGSLENLPMLQKVTVWMFSGDRIKEEDWCKAKETVRRAINVHPNHPTLSVHPGRGYRNCLDDPDSYGV